MPRVLNSKVINDRIKTGKALMKSAKKAVTEGLAQATKDAGSVNYPKLRDSLATFIKASMKVREESSKLELIKERESNGEV